MTQTSHATPTPPAALTQVPMSSAELPALDPPCPAWPGSVREHGGVRLHVRHTPGPDQQTAVYVHGLGGSASNWTDLAAALGPNATGLALDLPGFGLSEPDEGFGYTLAEHADTVTRFVASLDTGPVHLLGNSMGGAVSLLVAANRPDLVRTLTLVSPAMPDLRPALSRVSDPRLPLAMLPVIGKRVRAKLAGMTARERVEQVIRLCFHDPDSVPASRVEEAEAETMERMRLRWASAALNMSTVGIIRAWFSLGAGSLWSIPPKVRVPTLVVWGAEDRVVSVRKATRTAQLLPNARLLVLPRTGHVAQMEHPATVARAVLGMWEAHRVGTW
ncbi:MAG: alpha/beta fold hydrolase [Pseudonocardiaceae bacterium]|nr:alpha/beta fold hydrolase [Pseudonocardiaceae bacterium]